MDHPYEIRVSAWITYLYLFLLVWVVEAEEEVEEG